MTISNSFSKSERLNSKKAIDALFTAPDGSMAAFPLRVVWKMVEEGKVPVSVLISVPKKRLHHAVDRNRFKRQVREAYRTHKHALSEAVASAGKHLNIAFICISDKPVESRQVQKAIAKSLVRLQEKIN